MLKLLETTVLDDNTISFQAEPTNLDAAARLAERYQAHVAQTQEQSTEKPSGCESIDGDGSA
jgi:hypothetical protein